MENKETNLYYQINFKLLSGAESWGLEVSD